VLHDTSIGSEDSPQTGHTPLLRGVFFAGNIPNIRTPATDLPVISDRLSHNPPTASSSSRSAPQAPSFSTTTNTTASWSTARPPASSSAAPTPASTGI